MGDPVSTPAGEKGLWEEKGGVSRQIPAEHLHALRGCSPGLSLSLWANQATLLLKV